MNVFEDKLREYSNNSHTTVKAPVQVINFPKQENASGEISLSEVNALILELLQEKTSNGQKGIESVLLKIENRQLLLQNIEFKKVQIKNEIMQLLQEKTEKDQKLKENQDAYYSYMKNLVKDNSVENWIVDFKNKKIRPTTNPQS